MWTYVLQLTERKIMVMVKKWVHYWWSVRDQDVQSHCHILCKLPLNEFKLLSFFKLNALPMQIRNDMQKSALITCF